MLGTGELTTMSVGQNASDEIKSEIRRREILSKPPEDTIALHLTLGSLSHWTSVLITQIENLNLGSGWAINPGPSPPLSMCQRSLGKLSSLFLRVPWETNISSPCIRNKFKCGTHFVILLSCMG